MCFASSIVEAHKKLFIAPAPTPTIRDATAKISGSGNSLRRASAISKMTARSKSRLQTEVCGDCGATDPSWASINRAILLCADCCSVHRSLGRHISIVKSLRQGNWEPSVLNFVNSLNAHGANSVWEHHLLDGTTNLSSGKGATRWRKPTPKDPLHPNKSDFIKAKHVNLTFVLKPNLQDEDDVCGSNLEHELSKQLHASVRTSNLETSLRFLVQGADPNFYHDEKCSTPLHVAAKFGQASQIEMLLIYGADANALDGNGMTPVEVARANNHNTIAERLLDAMYDVTDRIIMFLGGKKPDHANGRHLVIPEAYNAEISEQLKIARGRLQLVPNKMFEELVMDLYDEVDRRECEAIWSTSALNAEHATVPFLPANPFLSATRNQGRQKLARFSRAEFAGLLTDVLIDARRRQNMANLRPLEVPFAPSHNKTTSNYNSIEPEHDPNLSDDEPIYDPVASDDDYAPVPPIAQQAIVHTPPGQAVSSAEMETLRKQISDYQCEISQLKNVVQKLSCENTELKSKFTSASSNSVYDEPLRIDLNSPDDTEHHEPLSLPEGISGLCIGGSDNSSSASSSANNSNQSTIKRPASMYERRLATNYGKTNGDARTTTSMYQMPGDGMAFGEEVKQRSDLVTRRLKELIQAMQPVSAGGNTTDELKQNLVPHGEGIRAAAGEFIALYSSPKLANANDTTLETLKQLARYNILIHHECENLQKAFESDDKAAVEKNTQEVRECAYHIARAMKTLVLQFY